MGPKTHKGLTLLCAFLSVVLFAAIRQGPALADNRPAVTRHSTQYKIQMFKDQLRKSESTISFWNNRGRWALHLQHDKCWQVHGKKRRKVCAKARESLREHILQRTEAKSKLQGLLGPVWCNGLTGNRALGCRMAHKLWPSAAEWDALEALWDHESSWNQYSNNPRSDACGIPQAMNNCSFGYDPAVQISWGLRYIYGRYGTPIRAYAAFRAQNWY